MPGVNERLRLLKKHHNPFKQFYDTNDTNMLNNRNVETKIIEAIKQTGFEHKHINPIINNKFVRPSTDDEWSKFHTTNEDGIAKAYEASSGLHLEDNKLFIAGTRGGNDVYDWSKIATGTFGNSKIYKNAEKHY